MRLFDTRRGEVAPLEPLGEGPIGLYVCGITPYDTTHLGHAFTYLAFDVLHRYLEFQGRPVRYVQNVTDVDDDMLRRAREVGEDYLALGRRFTARFRADMAALNWLAPDIYPRATEHVPQMVAMIESLLGRGLAYGSDGFVYLNVAAAPGWGSLSGVPAANRLAVANERGNRPDLPGKRDALDPVLWQPSDPGEPAWPSPWGVGRPGWHIECSAMSVTHLGPRFEIHGGGVDLAFPHHEAERVQSEGATGVGPVVGHWVHTGMVRIGDDKMSKSLGNLVLVDDLLDHWPADAVRLALIRHHYRSELAWDEGLVADTAGVVERWRMAADAETTGASSAPPPDIVGRRAAFLAALDDDLDTPRAVAILDDMAGLVLEGSADSSARTAGAAAVGELATAVLGLRLGDPS